MSLAEKEKRFKGNLFAYHALRAFGIKFDLFTLSKPEQARTFSELIKRIKNQFFPPIKIALIGDGPYTLGMKELLEALKVKEISHKHFTSLKYDRMVYTHITQSDLDGAQSPTQFFTPYVSTTDIILLGEVTLPNDTHLLTQEMMDTFTSQIKVVADTTEDLTKTIMDCTLRKTTEEEPYFAYLPKENSEVTTEHHAAITVLAMEYTKALITPEHIDGYFTR